MSKIIIPREHKEIKQQAEVEAYLNERSIFCDRWSLYPKVEMLLDGELLALYKSFIDPIMEKRGYSTADIIRLNSQSENLPAQRAKFAAEHCHNEDEVRFFVRGRGYFWFHFEDECEPVICVICEAGDLLGVPAGIRHWFEVDDLPDLIAIRFFTDPAGWVPEYTDSNIHRLYTRPKKL
ncbi:MAG: hypothetical protein SFT81_07815 [Candidatus Caenarcaniphilales bacterium]|nr:hypothetical protein [Candidatus Caenarcaniphilales bacterium]